MLVALSGSPGTGKSSASLLLEERKYRVLSLNELAINEHFTVGIDKERNSKIIDIERLDSYINKHYQTEDVIIIEGHSSHLLKSVDKVILLRCHPKQLKIRLKEKGWDQNKIKENVEAETIDVILCEAVEIHREENIFEIDTTHMKKENIASAIIEIVNGNFQPIKKYNIGNIDWSEEILNDY